MIAELMSVSDTKRWMLFFLSSNLAFAPYFPGILTAILSSLQTSLHCLYELPSWVTCVCKWHVYYVLPAGEQAGKQQDPLGGRLSLLGHTEVLQFQLRPGAWMYGDLLKTTILHYPPYEKRKVLRAPLFQNQVAQYLTSSSVLCCKGV